MGIYDTMEHNNIPAEIKCARVLYCFIQSFGTRNLLSYSMLQIHGSSVDLDQYLGCESRRYSGEAEGGKFV